MGLKDLVGKAQELAGSVGDVADRVLDEFNETLPVLRGLGFTLRELRVNMALPPEVSARLIASTDTIDVKIVQDLIDRNVGKRLVVTTLKGLLAAYHLRRQIPDLKFTGIELELALGLSPRVNVGFISNAA